MEPSDLSPTMTLADLWRVYDANCEPFQSVAQCDLYLRAANMLYRRLPAESEGAGERITLRDLSMAIAEARKARGILSFGAAGATVIIPHDDLR